MRLSIRLMLMGSALLSTPALLHAQQIEPSGSSEEDAENAIVVTGYGRTDQPTAATGLPLSPLETPQTISVITPQQIRDQGFNTINDALDFTVQPRRVFNFATRYDFTGTLDGLSLGGAVKWESRPPVTAVNPGSNVEERIGQPA